MQCDLGLLKALEIGIEARQFDDRAYAVMAPEEEREFPKYGTDQNIEKLD